VRHDPRRVVASVSALTVGDVVDDWRAGEVRSALEWAQVRALAADGVSQREIAGRLGINRVGAVEVEAAVADQPELAAPACSPSLPGGEFRKGRTGGGCR
jgi:hypothetical protein